MITLDTSAVIAIANADDVNHAVAMGILASRRDSLILPTPLLSEIAFMLESRGHTRSLIRFLKRLTGGRTSLDCRERDLPRIEQLLYRYADLRLGFSDACAIACAERHGGLVLTFDQRHFGAVAREGTIQPVPGYGAGLR